MKKLFLALFLSVCSLAFGQEYSDVSKDYHLTFPDALYYKKDFRAQWWYFTGYLSDQTGREFGYELTFFVVNVQKKNYASRFGVNKIFICSDSQLFSINSKHFRRQVIKGYGIVKC